MSNRAMAARYSGGGEYHPSGESLDLFGIRERRQKRQSDDAFTKQKELELMIQRYEKELENLRHDHAVALEQARAKAENDAKVRTAKGALSDSDLTDEQKTHVANIVAQNQLDAISLNPKLNPDIQLQNNFGVGSRNAGISFKPIGESAGANTKTPLAFVPGITGPSGAGVTGLQTEFGPQESIQRNKTSGGIDPVTHMPLPDVESAYTSYRDVPNSVPLNPSKINAVLQAMQGSPLIGPLTPFQAAAGDNTTPLPETPPEQPDYLSQSTLGNSALNQSRLGIPSLNLKPTPQSSEINSPLLKVLLEMFSQMKPDMNEGMNAGVRGMR